MLEVDGVVKELLDVARPFHLGSCPLMPNRIGQYSDQLDNVLSFGVPAHGYANRAFGDTCVSSHGQYHSRCLLFARVAGGTGGNAESFDRRLRYDCPASRPGKRDRE